MVALLVVGACSTVGTETSGVAETGVPAAIAGLDWHLVDDGEGLRLAYGRETSDDLALAFTCRPGSTTVEVARVADRAGSIVLEAGGDTETITLTAEPSGMGADLFLTGSMDRASPVLTRFAALGWIAVWQGDDRTPLVAHPAARPGVARFVEACRA